MEIGYSQPAIQGLFTVTHQYQVPPYQRSYAWESRHVDEFWADVSTVTEQGHFLGPMVLHNADETVRSVIDGQQRLTTMQMLIALMRDKYIELGDPIREGLAGDAYSVAPHSLIVETGYANRFRLRSGDANREVLEDFVLRKRTDPARKSFKTAQHIRSLSKTQRSRNKALMDAWLRLDQHLDRYLGLATSPLERLADLEDRVVRRVSVVVLDMRDLDDAYLLFETLNDRGLRLSAADLLKSHLLAKFDAQHQGDTSALDAAADDWDDMVDRLGGGDISGFLRHYLLLSHTAVKKADVFPLFKRDVREYGPDRILGRLVEMGGHYANFLRPAQDGSSASAVLIDLNSTSVDSHRIALMPARKYLSEADFVRFARLVETLSFRWVVTHGNAQVLESLYHDLGTLLNASEGTRFDDAQRLIVASLPSDAVFVDAFQRETLGYEYVARYALTRIENFLNDGEYRIMQGSSDVHVEHILPKTSNSFWESRAGNDEAYEEVAKRWGNLTLLLGRVNSGLGNGPWPGKRAAYADSAVSLTSDLHRLEDWDHRLIDARARWLASVASRVWSASPSKVGLPSFDEFLAQQFTDPPSEVA